MVFENFNHVNSNGEMFEFKKYGISINENSFRDYIWKYSTINNRITSFYKECETFPLELTVNIRGRNDYNDIKNMIYEHFEQDVTNNEMGYFEKDGYRLYCFVIGSEKKDYLIADRYMKIELTVLCEQKSWIKIDKLSFFADDGISSLDSSELKIYPYCFPYRYGRMVGNSSFINSSIKDSDFKIIIYGPVVDPSISIDGIVYGIEYMIQNGEYCIIDSKNREIHLYDNTGNKKNLFDYRMKEYNVFTKIKRGFNSVNWSASFGFDIELMDERSELKWI